MANAIDDVLFVTIQDAYLRGLDWGRKYGSTEAEELKASYDYADKTTAKLAAASPSPVPSQHTGWSDEAVEAAAEVLFNQRQTEHAWENAIEDDPESDAGTLASICRDDARAVASIYATPQAVQVNKAMTQVALDRYEGSPMHETTEDAMRAAITAALAASSIAPATGFEVKALAADADREMMDHSEMYEKHRPGCTCVIATNRNTHGVRMGYELGGYIKERCPSCISLLKDAASSIAPGFEVKNLEWSDWSEETNSTFADTVIGRYCVSCEFTDTGDHWAVDLEFDEFDLVEDEQDAKAKCYAHFSRRIRSCLSPSVAKESGEP